MSGFARLSLLVASTALAVAGCSSTPSRTSPGPAPFCDSADPCGCISPAPGLVCHAEGTACACDTADAGAEAGVPPPGPGQSVFAGRWSPVGGVGQSSCDGIAYDLPPDTSAVLTFTQDGAGALVATSSGAPGCSLDLVASADTASLARATETCPVAGGDPVTFTTFDLRFSASSDDASADAGSTAGDAGGDGGAPDAAEGAPSTTGDQLDWQLVDGDGTCMTTLHYTLVRVP